MKGNRSMQDMTEGRPISLILKFFFPLLFGMLFQQFYNLVDTAIVGKFLGPDDLAAVGATGSVNFLILGFCMGVCNGFSIPVAQKFGAKDESGLRRFVANSVWLSVIFAAVMTVVVCILCRQILIWMDTPANILEGSYRYIFVIFLGIPVTYLYNLLSGIMRALGDSKTPLIFPHSVLGLKYSFDLGAILILHMGVAGAAWATVTAQGISGVLCLIYMKKKYTNFENFKGGMEIKRKLYCQTLWHGNSYGASVFDYSNRQCRFTDCRKPSWFHRSCSCWPPAENLPCSSAVRLMQWVPQCPHMPDRT